MLFLYSVYERVKDKEGWNDDEEAIPTDEEYDTEQEESTTNENNTQQHPRHVDISLSRSETDDHEIKSSPNINNDIKTSKILLYNMHQSQLKKGRNFINDTTRIISILGGIDAILEDCLSTKYSLNLSSNQLHELHRVLSQQQQSTIKAVNTRNNPTLIDAYKRQTLLKSTGDVSNIEDFASTPKDDEFVYEFYEEDTYLHSIFSANTASVISNVIHSSKLHALISITVALYSLIFLTTISGNQTMDYVHIYYSIFMPTFVWMPYCLLWILGLNRVAFEFVNKSFDYWLKIVYGLMYIISFMLHKFYVDVDRNINITLSFAAESLLGISIILFICIVGSIDAAHMENRWKMIVSILGAAVYTGLCNCFL